MPKSKPAPKPKAKPKPKPKGKPKSKAKVKPKAVKRVKAPPAETAAIGLSAVSQVDLASILGLSSRQIRNLEKQGLPREEKGYPVSRCVRWYADFKQEEALQRAASREEPKDMEEAELRKAVADAEMAELKLARLRGEVAPIDQYRREMRRVLGRVRARFQSVPGEYAPRILEPMDMAAAVTVLRDLVATVLSELQRTGDTAGDEEDEYEEAIA